MRRNQPVLSAVTHTHTATSIFHNHHKGVASTTTAMSCAVVAAMGCSMLQVLSRQKSDIRCVLTLARSHTHTQYTHSVTHKHSQAHAHVHITHRWSFAFACQALLGGLLPHLAFYAIPRAGLVCTHATKYISTRKRSMISNPPSFPQRL